MAMDKMHAQIIERLDRIEAKIDALKNDPPVTLSTLKGVAADRPAPKLPPAANTEPAPAVKIKKK